MRLIDLEPEWIHDYNRETKGFKRADDTNTQAPTSTRSDPGWPPLARLSIENAQGILFLCPTCFVKNSGGRGTESVLCYFKGRGVPDDVLPGSGRWEVSGTGFEDLSLSPSVNVGHEHWHGWVTNGEVE